MRQGEWAEYLATHRLYTNHHTLTRRLAQLAQGLRRVPGVPREAILTMVKGCGGPWNRPEWQWYFDSIEDGKELATVPYEAVEGIAVLNAEDVHPGDDIDAELGGEDAIVAYEVDENEMDVADDEVHDAVMAEAADETQSHDAATSLSNLAEQAKHDS